MADKIATIDDIASHIYEPDTVGRNRCVTPTILHNNVLQNETYSIEGSYADNRLVPLSKISFSAASSATWTIRITQNSNIPENGLRINGSIAGHSFDKTLLTKSDRVTIHFDDYSNDFHEHSSYIRIERPSDGTGSGIQIDSFITNDYGVGFLDIQSLKINTNQTNGSVPHNNPSIKVVNDGDESDGIRPTKAWIDIAAPYFNPRLGEYGGSISFTHYGAQISITVSELGS